mgnify:CR=1 FL=1
MEAFTWTCPYCNRPTTVTDYDKHFDHSELGITNKHGSKYLRIMWVVCPNGECKEYTLSVSLHDYVHNKESRDWKIGKFIQSWNLLPPSTAKVFPEYVPEAIRKDYLESCLIKDLSPKASATLSRRCLQGMIRDFWGVKKTNLKSAIEKIKNRVDPLTWKAIDAVRKVGNIGAHMEKNIDLIIDVDFKEASLLISLIERLINDWYINRHEKEMTLEKIIEVADVKDSEKKDKQETQIAQKPAESGKSKEKGSE